MKKLLTILALSLLIFEGIFAYDALLNDGRAFSRTVGGKDSVQQIDIVKPKDDKKEYVREPEVKITPEYVKQDYSQVTDSAEAVTASSTDQTDIALDVQSSDFYEYHYSFLDDREKKVYRVMVDAFTNIETGNAVETLSDDEMNRVAQAVRNDHPELFYIGEMGYTHYTLGDEIQNTVLNVTYSDSEAEIRRRRAMIEKNARSIIAGISPEASDYEKTKYVYETVIDMTDYDTNSTDNQNIASVLLNGRSVCAGYAKTVQYLLNQMGVATTFIEGVDLIRGEGHAWNLVLIDGQYYYLDATWGDTSYKNVQGTGIDAGINYGYLNITTEELLRNHSIKNGIIVPECEALDANYYVYEGMFFEDYDEAAIKDLFDRAYDEGKPSVSFKCGSRNLFEEMKNEIITNQKVFGFMRNSKAVSYSVDEDERTFCFWL